MGNPTFKPLTSHQTVLFPEDIGSRISESHPVRLVDAVVNGLNIDSVLKKYKGGGTSSFHPRMMIKVIFYAYLSNIYSCRKIARSLEENIYFMWLSGNSTPDFRTINHFRSKRLRNELQELFSQLVLMLQEMGYVSLDVQYIDGTKIEARSGKYTFVWRKSVEKNKTKLEKKISSILADIDTQTEIDKQECKLPDEVSEPIDHNALKEKLGELNKRLKGKDKNTDKQLKKLQEEHLPRLEKYNQQLNDIGQRNSMSKTDKDATFMRMKDDHMKNGQLKAAYNVQISTENQFITQAGLHQTPGDTTTLESHLDAFELRYGRQSKEVVTDAGYGSEQNYEMLRRKSIAPYVKYNYFHKEQKRATRNNPFLAQNLYYNQEGDYFICPMGQKMNNVGSTEKVSVAGHCSKITNYRAQRCDGCPLRSLCHNSKTARVIQVNHRLNQLRQEAKELLTSEKGVKHSKKRCVEPEAVFGQLKSNNRFNRFNFFGKAKAEMELLLMAIGHNLRKLATNGSQDNFIATEIANQIITTVLISITGYTKTLLQHSDYFSTKAILTLTHTTKQKELPF